MLGIECRGGYARRQPLWLTGLLVLAMSGSSVAAAGRRPLAGALPAAVARLQPIGQFPLATHLHLALGLPLRQPEALDAFLADLYDPTSPRFRHYLTTREFAEQFGPTEQDYQTAIEFAQTNGFRVIGTHSNRLVLDVMASVGDIQRAFQTSLRVYPHPTEPRQFHAPAVAPSVPSGVPILDVSGLDDFTVPKPIDLRVAATNSPPQAFATGSAPGGDFIGSDFRAAYAFGAPWTGRGQVIGLFELASYFTNSIPLYQRYAKLPSDIVVSNILVNGYAGTPQNGLGDQEVSLDIEMAMSMAPGAAILVYEGNNPVDVLNRMATDNLAKQLSCSWGFGGSTSTIDNILRQFAAQGQTLFAASGDDGAYNSTNAPSAPMDHPFATAVGGTSLSTAGAGGKWRSETTWSPTGGGVSPNYAIPTWQRLVNMAANHGSGSWRNCPDVAAIADTTIFLVANNGQTSTVGGTSAAAPLWAGFMALVNQQGEANGNPPIGFLNPTLYSLGLGTNYTNVFHDITTGNNRNGLSPIDFSAVTGYDLCTGWGSPNGMNLINALAGPSDPLQISPLLGFTVLGPYGAPFPVTNVVFTLTNQGAAAVDWTLVSTSAWLRVSATVGTLPASAPTAQISVSLDPNSLTTLAVGSYYADIWFTNLTTGDVQTRLFTFVVSDAAWPIPVAGFNAGVIVPTNGTPTNPQAMAFDLASNYCFYAAGLNTNSPVAAGSGLQGLPATGLFTSLADGTTVFQLGPYGALNALLLGNTNPATGTLAVDPPRACNSLAVLAASAGTGTNNGAMLVVQFADGSSSPPFPLNAPDWSAFQTNTALQGFGRLRLGSNPFLTENPGAASPKLYQTVVDLAALGLNQPVSSLTFSTSTGTPAPVTGVFGISGAIMPPEVRITQPPNSVTNLDAAQPVTFTVAAMGAPPLGFQWYYSTNGADSSFEPLDGQTDSRLLLSSATPAAAGGSFFVVVTNSFNTVTSQVATLTVIREPVIVQQPAPTDIIVLAGQSIGLSVTAVGSMPYGYEWTFNGAPIDGATNAQRSLASLQPSASGSYAAVVTNAFGSVTSSVVSLTVLGAPAYGYGALVRADHPIAYWRLDETTGDVAHDLISARNGAYAQVQLGQPGNPAIDVHPAAGFGALSPTNSCVTNIPGIDFSLTSGPLFSVEAWVNGGTQIRNSGLVTKGPGGAEQFSLDCGGPIHNFRFFVRDTAGAAHAATSTAVADGKWHHLVGMCDAVRGNITLYLDGVSNASGTISAGSGLLSATDPVTIGSKQLSANTGFTLQWVGGIEEVAIYNYLLGPTRVLNHFRSATNRPPAIVATSMLSETNLVLNWTGGTGPFQVQTTTNLAAPAWQNLGVPVTSPPFLLTPTNDILFFRVQGN